MNGLVINCVRSSAVKLARFILLLAALLAGNVFANPIRVIGIGSDLEKAKQNAFVNAIEIYVGTVVVSEKELINQKLTKDEILNYSSGFIGDYKLVSQVVIGSQVQVVMDVTVVPNRISHRILGKHNDTKNIDNQKIKTQIDSFLSQRDNANKLLQQVLNDYPYKAFEIEARPFYIKNNYSTMQFKMPYKLNWNYNYLQSLNDTLNYIQDHKSEFLSRAPSQVHIMVKNPNDLFLGKKTKFEFQDPRYTNQLHDNFYNNELRILARLLNDKNQTVWHICHHPNFLSGKKPAFYSSGDANNLVFFGNAIEQGEITLDISPNLYAILNTINRIQLQIVKHTDC